MVFIPILPAPSHQNLTDDFLFQNFGLLQPIVYSHRILINTSITLLQMILYVNKGWELGINLQYVFLNPYLSSYISSPVTS